MINARRIYLATRKGKKHGMEEQAGVDENLSRTRRESQRHCRNFDASGKNREVRLSV